LRGQYRHSAALVARRAPVSRFIPAKRILRGDTLQLILRAIIQTGMLRAIALVLLGAATAHAQVRVTDDYGREVRLAAPAQRVVSLAPHLTELMYAAGAGAKLIGAIGYSDYPPEAKALPRVGSEAAIDLEALLALAPDLVVAWPNAGSARAVERIAALGIAVFRSEPRELEDIARTMETLGKLAGTEAAARVAASKFRARAATIERAYGQRPRVRVFYQVWDRPLVTVTGAHVISKAVRLCGGENVLAGLPGIAPEIDRETVLRADPEAIVASGPDGIRPSWLDDWKAYPALAAVRQGNLYAIRPELVQRHTPRLLDGAQELCRILEEVRAKRGPKPAALR
jgi:iron complex transport system substrate-binding protein